MTLIDLDKFIASFITAMKEYNPRIMSIPACIKEALYKQGLTYHDGQIVKNQIRISAEAKETGYSESEDEKIRKEIKQLIQGMHDADPRKERWLTWLEKQGDINRRIQEEVEKQTRQQWKPEIQGDNVSGECNDTALEEQLKIWFEKGKCSGIDDVIFHPQKYGLEKQGSIDIDIESMVSSYKQRLKSQGQGNLENNPLINMCVSAFKQGVENTLEELNLKKL